jgi:hypothetical protein
MPMLHSIIRYTQRTQEETALARLSVCRAILPGLIRPQRCVYPEFSGWSQAMQNAFQKLNDRE